MSCINSLYSFWKYLPSSSKLKTLAHLGIRHNTIFYELADRLWLSNAWSMYILHLNITFQQLHKEGFKHFEVPTSLICVFRYKLPIVILNYLSISGALLNNIYINVRKLRIMVCYDEFQNKRANAFLLLVIGLLYIYVINVIWFVVILLTGKYNQTLNTNLWIVKLTEHY